MNATDLAAYNPNYVMGDIIGGANDGLQMVLRRASASTRTPPGSTGVPVLAVDSTRRRDPRGCVGFNAAQRALRHAHIPEGPPE